METLNYMFDERNPNNLIKSCSYCCMYILRTIGILILVVGIIVGLHYTGTYLLFGFIVAGSPDYNRTTGCPNGMNDCLAKQKLMCYQEKMLVCHIFGLITLLGIATGLLTTIILIGCIYLLLDWLSNCIYDGIYTAIKSYSTASDMTEKTNETLDAEHQEENIPLDDC